MTPVAEDDELVLATNNGSGGLSGSGNGAGGGHGEPLKPAQAARMRAMTLLPAAVADMTNALHAVTAGFNALLLAQAHGAAAGDGAAAALAGAGPLPSPSASVSAAVLSGATGGAGAVPVSSVAGFEGSTTGISAGGTSSGSGLIFTNLQELCVGTFTFALQELVEAAADLALAVRRLWHAQGDPFGSLRV